MGQNWPELAVGVETLDLGGHSNWLFLSAGTLTRPFIQPPGIVIHVWSRS